MMLIAILESVIAALTAHPVLASIAIATERVDESGALPYIRVRATETECGNETEKGWWSKLQLLVEVFGRTGASALKTYCEAVDETLLPGFTIADAQCVYVVHIPLATVRIDAERSNQHDVATVATGYEVMVYGVRA